MSNKNTTSVTWGQYNEILRAPKVEIHHLLRHFKKTDMDFDTAGNIFVNFKKETRGTPILVAHLDNVLHGDREPVMDVTGTRLFGKKTGIGFDDKAGIIAIIEIWRRSKTRDFRVIFTADEEVGGLGALAIQPQVYEDAAYIIELDRKGGSDLISNSGGTRLCSKAFASMFYKYGFKDAVGTFTDVNIFKPETPTVNMVNLSIGYYSPHTDNEYLNINEFEHIVDSVFDFVENNKESIIDDEPFEKYTPSYAENSKLYSSNYGKSYGSSYERYDGMLSNTGNYRECDWCGCYFDKSTAVYDEYGQRFCSEECKRACEKELDSSIII